MNKTKPWWQSKTVIASAVTVLASALSLFGVYIPEALQSELTLLILNGVTLATGALAWWGRVSADSKITFGATSKEQALETRHDLDGRPISHVNERLRGDFRD